MKLWGGGLNRVVLTSRFQFLLQLSPFQFIPYGGIISGNLIVILRLVIRGNLSCYAHFSIFRTKIFTLCFHLL